MKPIWHQLNSTQIHYIVELLDSKPVKDYVGKNDWYSKFLDGVRFDVIRKQAISQNQLHQVKKLAAVSQQCWRLLI